ncbi:MAG: hypothetical protein ACYTEQ_05755 [Planctomycetota bacterium]|jgi:hypothetical protein
MSNKPLTDEQIFGVPAEQLPKPAPFCLARQMQCHLGGCADGVCRLQAEQGNTNRAESEASGGPSKSLSD